MFASFPYPTSTFRRKEIKDWVEASHGCDAVHLALGQPKRHISQLMLPDEGASPEQMARFKAMTPEERYQAAHDLYWTMRRHKAAFLRSIHPDWPEEKIQKEIRRIFLCARS